MTEAALQEFIKREFPAEMPVTEVADKLDTMQAHPDIEQIRTCFNNVLLDAITLDYLEYSENRKNFLKEQSVQLFFRNTEKILGNPYFQAVACFFKGQYEKSLRLVRTVMKSNAEEEPYNLQELAYCYIVPFKNAFPGFWQMVVLQLKQSGAEQLVIEHAELVRDYYFAATEEEKCLLLTDFLQNHSDSVIAHELLGMTYGRMKRWKNQIACLETIEEQPCLFTKACINFQIGWAYGKEKDWEQEEAYYRNCLELEWDYPFANNNLAYSFYQQKRYAEAKELLEFCLERNWIYPVQRIIMCGFCLQWAIEQPHVPLSNPEHIRFLNRWSSGQKRRKIGNQLFYQQNQQSKPKQGCKRNPLKKQNSFPVNGYWKKN